MTYAYPRPGDLLTGLRQLLRDYREDGGATPSVLFHDEASGEALAQGLAGAMPEHVLPVTLEEIGSVGMDVWLGCLAWRRGRRGAARAIARHPSWSVRCRNGLTAQAILGGMGYREDRLRIANGDQPAATMQALSTLPTGEATAGDVRDAGRGQAGIAAARVAAPARPAPASKRITLLDRSAPFGDVRVDPNACTLCMSCVSSCPTHALQDDAACRSSTSASGTACSAGSASGPVPRTRSRCRPGSCTTPRPGSVRAHPARRAAGLLRRLRQAVRDPQVARQGHAQARGPLDVPDARGAPPARDVRGLPGARHVTAEARRPR